ncbi:tensin-1-like isoform X6 [Lytechinus variegatus]|uniref:tensin-1-like isoform X6 n=1 Tax=Lytechinus variegatus TaxID=7654 RepID=UPI001BB1A877|nr:tensin-1-like isoform X6 [Lytechinus variegatus]
MAKEVKHLAWKLNCYKVMTTCLPQSPTTNEKFKHGSPKSPRSPRISPEGKYIFGSSPSENRRKKPSSSPSTPTTPTPPSTPRLPHTPATARKMQQLDESPKLQPVQSIMQQSTVQIQHAPPPPQQQQQQPQQRIQQQQHQPQQLIQHQMQPQTIQTKSISIKSGDGLVRYSFDLEVDYITERLIAVSFPSGGLENQYRSNLRDVVRMLKSKHNNCYVVFNLSRRRHDVSKLNQEVRDLGWPNILAPPLERLCSICKQIETWMKGNLNNVVVLHCKGGRGPIGVVVSAFMNYLSITSGNDSTMDRHAMKRFLDAKGWGSMHPSQMRYIDYFSGLLTNSIQINSSPLFLHHAVIHGVPNYDSNGGCRPFLRVYQGMSPVYTSGVYTVPEGTSRFVITPGRAIPLRGDILLKCYHKKFRSTTRDTIFRCQFHTTAVMEYRLVFQKQELDDACTDARFPEFTKVELIFSSTPDALHGSDYVSGASFPSEHIDDPLIRWDSYEHFNDIIEGPEDGGPDLNETSGNNNNNMILDIPHSSAPDGSLYAQVKKTPSPEQSPVIPRLTNGDSNAPLPYVLSPDRAPQVHTSKDGGKRNMDYRERMALDELLKGITGEDTDGGIVVNNNIQWKAPPSPDNKVLHHDPVHTRRIVSVSEDLRHAPVSQSKPKPPPPVQEDIKEEAAGQENSSPSKKPASRKESSEAENPYAEITDAMQQKLQQNPNTNQSGPQQERIQQEVVQQEMITPVLVTNKEQSAPPMMNGGISVPRSVEQHNPTYEITPKGSNHRTMQNGPVSQNGRVVQNGPMVQNGQVNLNPGQVNLNPGQINVPNGPTPMTYNQIGHNASPAQPYVAQMNGPVETPIVPNSVSRVTERTPYASRLENGPTSPVHTKYEARPVKAREDRFQLLRKGPNAPEQYQPSPPSPAQVSPVSPTNNGDDDGLGWLRRQQDKLREKREREQGRPIVRESPGEPIRVTPVNASPKLRVRFEGDVEPAPPMVSPPLSAKREEPPSWLAQQQQKLQDRQGNNITPINQAPVVATEVTPVQNAMSPAPDHLLMTGTQDGGVSLRRGVSPPPLSISKDLEQSISELGQMNTAKPAQSYVQRTVTTTTTREWEPHERPLNRQLSDLTHDRVRDPVYQRPADDQSPKVPATPSTPYDPVPPILTNSQLRNDGPQATSTPRKNFDEVDLHIDEPTEVDNIPRGVVADRSPNFVDRTPPATQSRPPRRTNSQSGYDSDTGIQQYYRPPRRRNLIDPGAEVWLQNPGGLPRKESEFWNRKDGLKSPEPPKEYDLSSSTESISGSKTPKFPVGPRAYANMTKTFIVKTGAPPHGEKGKVLPPVLHADYHLGPDQPLPLQRTMQRQDSFEIPPVPEPAARPAPTAEVHAPPRQPAPVPVTEPAREIQPTQPMFSETRVITVENRTEPSRQPMEWTPTPPAPPSQEQRYYTPTPTRPTPADDESFRQLEYLESEPWLGRKPIIHSPPHRPNAPVEVQPWIPPVVTTTMSTTGPVQTVTNGVPQTVTTTQWRREVTHQQQPIEITPITREVTEDVEARKPRNILDPPPSLLEDVVEPPTVSPVVEARFTPRYVREVNAAPPPSAPLPPATTPPQPSVVQYQEQPPRSRAMEPPITEVRLHPVELGPIQVVPVETQVIIDRKEQYPGQDARQQAAPVHSPVTSQQYQAPSSQPHQGTVTPPPTYGTVMARSPSPTFGIVKTSAPQASHGFVQNSPSSPVSYVTAPPASAPSSYSTVQPVSPPMSYGTVQSTPQRGVMTGPGQEPSIIHQRVEVREITQTESVPVSQTLQQQQPHQQPLQQHQEPPILQQTQQQVQQDIPSEQAPVSPEQPSATLNERLLNQPKPPVQYPTFSDRHRKAAKGPVDDSLPNGGAGYRTIYDNRRQRSSLGNEGQLPSPGGLSGKGVLNGSTTPPTLSGRSTPSNFYYTQKLSPYGSSSSLADPSVEHVRFVKDLSAWWYKPNISRDDAINILKDKPPGTFIVRDSNSFPGAFGLALKVAQVPANTTPRKGGDPQSELVRHFLIEPNARGVRLKGCVNEPIFSSLSALIYQHTLTQLALPIKLVLPDMGGRYSSASNDYPSGADATDAGLDPKSAASLLQQGAACKVLYIDSVDMESLTGTEAIREGLTKTLTAKKKPEAVVVHFKVSSKGITLTDTQRKLFFRKHYPVKSILFCGMDPLTRKYPRKEGQEVADAKIFGFVARKPGSLTDNQCHLFADWEVEQPASAIVSFVTKVMLGSASKSSVKTP